MPRRILMLLADEYRPDPRVRKEALALIEEGMEVTVLEWDRSCSRASRNVEGVEVIGVRAGKAVDMLSTALRFPLFILKALLRGLKIEADAVHAHDLDTLLPAALISRLRGIPLVYDAHEYYSAMVADHLPSFMCAFLDKMEAWLVRQADLAIAVNEKVEEHLRPNVSSHSIIVMNCIELGERRPPHAGREITMIYAGALEPFRYLKEVTDVIRGEEGVRMLLAGEGSLKETLIKKAGESENIEFIGYLPHSSLIEVMKECDVVLCLMDPSNKNNQIGTPNKLFESMAVGIPVLVSEGTLCAEIVRREQCGLAIEWSQREFRRAIEILRDPAKREQMASAGRRAAESTYNWGIMKERLISAYRNLLEVTSGTRR